MKNKILISLVVAAVCCGNANALTLNDAVIGVVEKNPGVKSKLNAYKQDIEAYKIAQAGYYPTLDFDASSGKEKIDSEVTKKETDFTTKSVSLTAKQNLFNGFATKLSLQQANHKVYSSGYDYIGVANELAISAIETYIGILKEKEILAIEKRNYTIHEQMFSDISKKYDSGLGKISDVKEVKSRLSLAYANYIGQEQALSEKVIQFNSLYGDIIDTASFEKYNSNIIIPATLRDMEEIIVLKNPNIKMKEAELSSAQISNQLASKGYFPKLDLELSRSKTYDQGGSEGKVDNTSAMFKLSYNLYNGGIDAKSIQKSLSNVLQKQEELQTKKQDEIKKLHLFYTNKVMTEKRMEHLNVYAAASQEKLMSYKEEFELGRRSLLDLLGAEDDYNNARKQLIRAGYEYDLSKYKIVSALGKLLDNFGLQLENSIIKDDKSVNMESYKEDVIAEFVDSDKDKIEDTKDLCLNSLENSVVNSTGCSKSVVDFAIGVKSAVGVNDILKEKDIVALNDTSKMAKEATKDGVKKFKLKNFAFLRNNIDGEIEYMWPSGIIVQGTQKDKWVEISKRLGQKGEVLGEFKLWISASDIEEI